MRVLVIVKATEDSEAGVMPSQQLLGDMGRFNEELIKAGVMLAGEGLHPSVRGKRVQFSGSRRTVVDGPFSPRPPAPPRCPRRASSFPRW